MEKKVITWHGRKYYLLGADRDGINYWLEEGRFDCGWYWGFGYIETFSNNKNPHLSNDIRSHSHFDFLFLNKMGNSFDTFKNFIVETPLSDREIWQIIELMKSFYIARKYSDMIYCGGAHITQNPVYETIKDESEYKRINEVVIPAMLNALYEIMSK